MSDISTDPPPEPRKVGTLKALAGPKALHRLLPMATMELEGTARQTAFELTRVGAETSAIEGTQIESVQRHGASFTVILQPPNQILTFGALSDTDADEWVSAIEAIKAAAAMPSTRAVGEAPADRPTTITLTYNLKAAPPVTKEFALLVIACDPRNLIGICDYSPEEIATFNELVNFTFHTTLTKVKVNAKTWLPHGVIFAPGALNAMDGSVYGFRNESAKQFGLEAAKSMEYNTVTVYQLLGVTSPPWTPDQFEKLLKDRLPSLTWWPFGADYEILTSVTTPYFDHFPAEALRMGKPWDLLGDQGDRGTLLVHASTCFESALHCWGYAGLMLESEAGAKQALPSDKNAPIAILGAGVSGLLFATRLTRLGYTNVELLESTDRYGGKTHTIIQDGPYPPGPPQQTVCELGTCYLSPAYAPMVADLSAFLAGNEQIDFTQGRPTFRGIATAGQLPADFHADAVMNFGDYVILKAVAELGLSDDALNRVKAQLRLAVDLAIYGVLHGLYVGWNPPMPTTKPGSLDGPFGRQTFGEFLQAHDLKAMWGSLQYGYEVQGYGNLNNIPAYYGLLWITPPTTWAILVDALPDWIVELFGLKTQPVVTAWTKGWGDVWDQIVSKQNLRITCNAEVTRVVRS